MNIQIHPAKLTLYTAPNSELPEKKRVKINRGNLVNNYNDCLNNNNLKYSIHGDFINWKEYLYNYYRDEKVAFPVNVLVRILSIHIYK